MLVACPQCGQSNALPGQYCDNCGAKLEKICRSCSVANRPNARFCANCGTALATPERSPGPAGPDTSGAQQKQVTVLFADICGPTELVSRVDAEDTSHPLRSLLDALHKAATRSRDP